MSVNIDEKTEMLLRRFEGVVFKLTYKPEEEIAFYNWDLAGFCHFSAAGGGGRAQLCPAPAARDAALGWRHLE